MINAQELKLLKDTLQTLEAGFTHMPEFVPQFDELAAANVLQEVARRMQDNYPYYHPLYAGQMLKPPHPIARIAYAMSLWVNPNNHALDGGKASSALEKECIVELGAMFGWESPLGHLTGGGTMANLEALWVANRLQPGKRVIASEQAHYTHSRISEVLGIPFTPVAVDAQGRMETAAVEALLQKGDVGTVVVTMGNTGFGAVDPLPEILQLRERASFRIHADAAYGGYFGLADHLSAETRAAFDAVEAVDSIVIDPHKHGLQPYGCGSVLFKDSAVGAIYKHDSPYTYFSSAELHLGEISLECSRAGASAVALWATQKLLPLKRKGEFAEGLSASVHAAQTFHSQLGASDFFAPLVRPELDIVVYAARARSTTVASAAARKIFELAANANLHLALIDVPAELANHYLPDIDCDSETLTCLRSVLMKPEHEAWTARIVSILEDCARESGTL